MPQISSWWGGSTPAPETESKPYNPSDPKQNPLNPQGLKSCCACPETKSARDDCFLRFDSNESSEKCKELVQAHLACMRGYGFKV
ncbi:hypothetical protein BDW22DRAFT_1325444 [Trametopsis cervina]|nr:hypothetical protein BDW22DRAFT_1325444 [Trametopsis cervina]